MPDADAALLSAEEMLALYTRRMLSPVDVLQAVTERIAQLNPMLNAFAVLNPRAIEIGDRERNALAHRAADRRA